MLFLRRKISGPTVKDSLATKPVQLVDPDIEETADGGARMKVRIRATGWTKFFRVPDSAAKTFELDSIGLAVWRMCDGHTSVQQIIRRLASQYKLNLREAEVSTQVFLRTLIKKGLLGVPMKKSGDGK